MMTLPVSDAVLVGFQTFFTAATIAILTGLGTVCARLAYSSQDVLGVGTVGFCIGCLTLSMQAITWSRLRGTVAKPFLLTVLILWCLLGPFILPSLGLTIWDFVATLGGSAAISLPLAFLGFSIARHGKSTIFDKELLSKFERQKDIPALKPFPSKFSTQLWADFRRHGRAVGWIIFLLAASEIFITWMERMRMKSSGHPVQDMQFGGQVQWMLGLSLLMCFLLGSAPRRTDLLRPGRGLQSFLSTRPITGSEAVKSLFACSAITAAIAWCFLVATMSWWFFFPAARQYAFLEAGGVEFDLTSAKQIVLIATALVWLYILLWNALTALFTPEVTGDAFMSLGFVVFTGAIIFQSSLQHEGNNELTMPYGMFTQLMWGAVAAKLIGAGYAARATVKQELLNNRDVIQRFGIWILVTSILVAAMNYCRPHILSDSAQLIPGMILSVPLARLFAAPLAFEWNRHE
jgi:hypothetical protein